MSDSGCASEQHSERLSCSHSRFKVHHKTSAHLNHKASTAVLLARVPGVEFKFFLKSGNAGSPGEFSVSFHLLSETTKLWLIGLIQPAASLGIAHQLKAFVCMFYFGVFCLFHFISL